MMRILIFLFSFSLASWQAFADHIPEDYQLQGSGELKYAFIKIYFARLYAPQKLTELQAPLILQLQYHRDVPADRIIKATMAQMDKQAYTPAGKGEQWRQQLTALWPDIEEDDTLSAYYSADGSTEFFHNHQAIGGIADPEFGYAFFAIWLAEDTSNPDLRAELLGL